MTSNTMFDLQIKIWSDVACWAPFNCIIREKLLEGKLPGFDALEQAFEPVESTNNMCHMSAD